MSLQQQGHRSFFIIVLCIIIITICFTNLSNALVVTRFNATAPIPHNDNRTLVVSHTVARYGPSPYNITAQPLIAPSGDVELCDDTKSYNFTNHIVLALRGNCSFITKTIIAQKNNASGVVLGNVDDDLIIPSYDPRKKPDIDITIPTLLTRRSVYEHLLLLAANATIDPNPLPLNDTTLFSTTTTPTTIQNDDDQTINTNDKKNKKFQTQSSNNNNNNNNNNAILRKYKQSKTLTSTQTQKLIAISTQFKVKSNAHPFLIQAFNIIGNLFPTSKQFEYQQLQNIRRQMMKSEQNNNNDNSGDGNYGPKMDPNYSISDIEFDKYYFSTDDDDDVDDGNNNNNNTDNDNGDEHDGIHNNQQELNNINNNNNKILNTLQNDENESNNYYYHGNLTNDPVELERLKYKKTLIKTTTTTTTLDTTGLVEDYEKYYLYLTLDGRGEIALVPLPLAELKILLLILLGAPILWMAFLLLRFVRFWWGMKAIMWIVSRTAQISLPQLTFIRTTNNGHIIWGDVDEDDETNNFNFNSSTQNQPIITQDKSKNNNNIVRPIYTTPDIDTYTLLSTTPTCSSNYIAVGLTKPQQLDTNGVIDTRNNTKEDHLIFRTIVNKNKIDIIDMKFNDFSQQNLSIIVTENNNTNHENQQNNYLNNSNSNSNLTASSSSFSSSLLGSSNNTSLSHLKKSTNNNKNHHHIRVHNDTCSICLTPMNTGDNVKVLYCYHAFHTACINEHFRVNNVNGNGNNNLLNNNNTNDNNNNTQQQNQISMLQYLGTNYNFEELREDYYNSIASIDNTNTSNDTNNNFNNNLNSNNIENEDGTIRTNTNIITNNNNNVSSILSNTQSCPQCRKSLLQSVREQRQYIHSKPWWVILFQYLCLCMCCSLRNNNTRNDRRIQQEQREQQQQPIILDVDTNLQYSTYHYSYDIEYTTLNTNNNNNPITTNTTSTSNNNTLPIRPSPQQATSSPIITVQQHGSINNNITTTTTTNSSSSSNNVL